MEEQIVEQEQKKPENKVRSIRADEETYARLQEIAARDFPARKENGNSVGGQAAAMAALVAAYEMQQAQEVMSDRAAAIAEFDDLTTRLKQNYLASLQLTQTAAEQAERAVADKVKQLEQAAADAQDARAAEAIEREKAEDTLAKQIITLKEAAEAKAKAEEAAAEAKARAEEQAEVIALQKEQLTAAKAEVEKNRDAAGRVVTLEQEVRELTKQVDALKAAEQLSATQHKAEIETLIAKAEADKQAALAALRSELMTANSNTLQSLLVQIAPAQNKPEKEEKPAQKKAPAKKSPAKAKTEK